MNPLRAELLGILSALYILYKVERTCSLPLGTIEFVCDNKEAIGSAMEQHRPDVRIATQEEHDILIEIHYLRQKLKTSLSVTWVKSHSKILPLSPQGYSHEEAHHIAYTYTSESPLNLPLNSDGHVLPFHVISMDIN
jgi:hypothetical protein